jgi:hypothetical protein
VSANAEVATTRTGDELHRRFQQSSRSAIPRSGGITGWELDNLIVPVVGDFIKEMRASDAKLTERLEHLGRRIELLDIRTRGQPEPRKVLFRVQQLEMEVALLRRAGKK